MKRRVVFYMVVAIILFAVNESKAGPGKRCKGGICNIKYVGKEKVHIGAVYTGHTFNLIFNTSGRIQDAQMGNTFEFKSQRSYGAIIRLMSKRQVGLRASLGASHLEYLVSATKADDPVNYEASRRDIDFSIGLEKHIAFSKVVRTYIGPNIPLTIKGTSKTEAIDITENPISKLSVGGGLTTGLIFKVSKMLTLGIDCEALYRSQKFSISGMGSQAEEMKFGNLGLKGNIYLGVAF